MKKEINLVKEKYLSIAPPKFLEAKGLDDLWMRVDVENSFYVWRMPWVIIALIIILILASSFMGAAVTYAKPGTLFYPVKVLTEKALNSAIQVLPPLIKTGPTTTPAANLETSPAPTEDESEQVSKSKSGKSIEDKEVEGVSTQRDEKENSSEDSFDNERKDEEINQGQGNRSESKNNSEGSGSENKAQDEEKDGGSSEEPSNNSGKEI